MSITSSKLPQEYIPPKEIGVSDFFRSFYLTKGNYSLDGYPNNVKNDEMRKEAWYVDGMGVVFLLKKNYDLLKKDYDLTIERLNDNEKHAEHFKIWKDNDGKIFKKSTNINTNTSKISSHWNEIQNLQESDFESFDERIPKYFIKKISLQKDSLMNIFFFKTPNNKKWKEFCACYYNPQVMAIEGEGYNSVEKCTRVSLYTLKGKIEREIKVLNKEDLDRSFKRNQSKIDELKEFLSVINKKYEEYKKQCSPKLSYSRVMLAIISCGILPLIDVIRALSKAMFANSIFKELKAKEEKLLSEKECREIAKKKHMYEPDDFWDIENEQHKKGLTEEYNKNKKLLDNNEKAFKEYQDILTRYIIFTKDIV